MVKQRCFAHGEFTSICKALTHIQPGCGTTKCPFFKPEGCRSYIRTVNEEGKVIFVKNGEIYKGAYV